MKRKRNHQNLSEPTYPLWCMPSQTWLFLSHLRTQHWPSPGTEWPVPARSMWKMSVDFAGSACGRVRWEWHRTPPCIAAPELPAGDPIPHGCGKGQSLAQTPQWGPKPLQEEMQWDGEQQNLRMTNSKAEDSLTRGSGEVNREGLKQPLVGPWAKQGCVGRVGNQVGQFYWAGVTREILQAPSGRIPGWVILEFIVTSGCCQEGGPLKCGRAGGQFDHLKAVCLNNFWKIWKTWMLNDRNSEKWTM